MTTDRTGDPGARTTGPGPTGATRPFRVLLVDDQDLVRAGIGTILEAQPDLTVVGEARTGRQALTQARALRPDVICMDVQMTDMDGLEATRLVVSDPDLDAAVLILTTFHREDYLVEALGAGASGFLLKNSRPEQLVEGVRSVAAGDALLAPEVTRTVIARAVEGRRRAAPAGPAAPPGLAALTEREREVLQLVARGLTNDEIAAELYLGRATVKTHVSNLLMKLDLRDRVQAVVFAYENDLVRP